QHRPPPPPHQGTPPATHRRLEAKHRHHPHDGTAQQLPHGRIHLPVHPHRPASHLHPHPPPPRPRPARRRPDRRRTPAGRPPATDLPHPRTRTPLDRSPPSYQLTDTGTSPPRQPVLFSKPRRGM